MNDEMFVLGEHLNISRNLKISVGYYENLSRSLKNAQLLISVV